MNWACELTSAAEKDLEELPSKIQERVARVVQQMTTDPLQGDVKALQGKEWKGILRRRIGSYRVLFTADNRRRTVSILRIVARSEETYR